MRNSGPNGRTPVYCPSIGFTNCSRFNQKLKSVHAYSYNRSPPSYWNRYTRVLGARSTIINLRGDFNGETTVESWYLTIIVVCIRQKKTTTKNRIKNKHTRRVLQKLVWQPPFIRHPRDDGRKRFSRVRVAITRKNGFFYLSPPGEYFSADTGNGPHSHPSETAVFLLLLPPHAFG